MLFNKNDKAVSPIVATLVLIVVAIVGAIAVGVLMGAFNNQVSDEANASGVKDSYTQEITLAGSTTCYPVTAKLATAFMDENKQIKVTVGEGGSDAGLAGVEAGSIMIGMASKLKDTSATGHPEQADLVGYQIGGRGVAVIAGSGVTVTSATAANLNDAYTTAANGIVPPAGTNPLKGCTLYQRLDGSGTEEAFAKFIGGTFATAKNVDSSSALAESGNEGVLQSVQSNTNGIGFVDFGYVDSATKRGTAKLLQVADTTITTPVDANSANILAALKDSVSGTPESATTKYPLALVSPLMYYTKGDATTLEQTFIDYAKSPAQLNLFHAAGVYGISEM